MDVIELMVSRVADPTRGSLYRMFGFFRKKPHETTNMAAEYTDTSLLNQMVIPFAEELLVLDDKEHAQIYRALEAYDGPQITSQEMLPEGIRKIMNL